MLFATVPALEPSTRFNSAAVEVTPSKIFNSAPVEVNAVPFKARLVILALDITTEPVPLGVIVTSILSSSPEAIILGPLPVAALETVNSFTALATVAENLINSAAFASAINPAEANLGAVSVLLVNVTSSVAPIAPTSPAVKFNCVFNSVRLRPSKPLAVNLAKSPDATPSWSILTALVSAIPNVNAAWAPRLVSALAASEAPVPPLATISDSPNLALNISPSAILAPVTALAAISVVPTASAANLALVTASSAILAVSTALAANSVGPTAEAPILALVTASSANSVVSTAPAPILALVTASSANSVVPTAPAPILALVTASSANWVAVTVPAVILTSLALTVIPVPPVIAPALENCANESLSVPTVPWDLSVSALEATQPVPPWLPSSTKTKFPLPSEPSSISAALVQLFPSTTT